MATPLAFGGGAPRQQDVGPGMTSTSLGSWKEIASFFAKTTRTVQRWERTENLPVYRHVHEKGCTVYAFESELTGWRDARSRNRGQGILRGRATSRRLRLAVLPFLDLSAKHQLRHFEDALTYELIVQLARLNPAGLGVIAYTSVMRYKESACNIAQIGSRLKVDFVLEGSVRLGARQVRIAAQLIHVHDQTQLFADACARRWRDGFASQVVFAERMTRMVGKHLFASARQ
jgi:TolB-like protein